MGEVGFAVSSGAAYKPMCMEEIINLIEDRIAKHKLYSEGLFQSLKVVPLLKDVVNKQIDALDNEIAFLHNIQERLQQTA